MCHYISRHIYLAKYWVFRIVQPGLEIQYTLGSLDYSQKHFTVFVVAWISTIGVQGGSRCFLIIIRFLTNPFSYAERPSLPCGLCRDFGKS